MVTELPGAIALVGGNEFRAGSVAADQHLLAAAGGPNAAIVILPTAAAHQRPDLAAATGRRHFAALGAVSVRAVAVLDPASAADPAHAAAIRSARLIYLTGGDPRHLKMTLAGSAAWAAIRAALAAGAILAGSSAGAMVLGSSRGRTGRFAGIGLDLLPNLVVLPHHQGPAPPAGLAPNLIGLGIAEETTFFQQSGGWLNLGPGEVWIYRVGRAPEVIAAGTVGQF